MRVAISDRSHHRHPTTLRAAMVLLTAAAATADPLNVPITAPQILNTNAIGDAGQDLSPRVAVDGAGHWIAVWQSSENLNGSIGIDYDIFVSRSSDRGITWTPPAALNSTAPSDGTANDTLPTIAPDAAGTWIAVWESRYNLGGTIGTDTDIFISRSVNNGQTWSAAAVLNGNAATDQGAGDLDPQIATDGNGMWLAVWRSLDTLLGTLGNDADLLFSRSTDAGVTWTAPVKLNTNAGSDSGQDVTPRIATDRQGHWVAVWRSNDTLGGTIGTDYDIFVSRSADNAMTWSPPQALNTNAATDSRDDIDPAIATDRNGNWVVVWTSEDSLGGTINTDRDILVSRSTNNGMTWSAPQPLHATAATDVGQDDAPSIATDGQGRWVTTWHSTENLNGAIGTDADIFVARSDDAGATWSFPIALNGNAAGDSGADDLSVIVADESGTWLAVWDTHDNYGGIGVEGDLLCARFALPDCNRNTVPDAAETDCNGNMIPDDCDIASGASLDVNGNGVPDECEPPPPSCPADIAPLPNHDGVVNVTDLLAVINAWGACGSPCPPNCAADINHDCAVNVSDLLAVINGWGPCP